MASYTVECECGCGPFRARSPRAKWRTPGCKKRRQRHPEPSVEEAAEAEEVESNGLSSTVREELRAAGRLDTFYGRLAVQLATRLEKPDETGVSSLSKELRLVMEAALSGVKPADPVDEEPDEVEQARRRRQEMAERARLSAEPG